MSENKKAIIFGKNGQDGFYLSKLLENENIEVIGVSRKNSEIIGDIKNYNFVNEIINTIKPEYIYCFAANSKTSHEVLFENHETISTGSLNVLESVKLHCPNAKVFLSGSAMQFKNVGKPIDEKSPFESSSPYSIARIHSVYAARYYREKFGIKAYVGYLFNHDSPLRNEHHVNQKIVRTIQRIKSGSKEKLELGNIDIEKEFTFAGDIVEAIWTLTNQDEVFEAIIGSGKKYTIREWMEYCFNKVNLNYKDYISINENYITEYKTLVSNPEIIMKLGWFPKTDIYMLADMMMEKK